jgi:hypothetical protein
MKAEAARLWIDERLGTAALMKSAEEGSRSIATGGTTWRHDPFLF